MLKDINTGSGDSDPQNFVARGNGQVLFSANDGTHGYELWVTDGTAAGTYQVKDIAPNAANSHPADFALLCFAPGTRIRTPAGEVTVETLRRRDLVVVTDGRVVPITWIGRQTVSTRFGDPLRVLPIRIRAGALATNVPSRDLLVTPDHAVLVDDVLIQAGALVNGTSIVRERNVPERFTYYHIELDDHSLLLAENTPAETFVDNVDRLAFDNWAEHEAIYPEGKPIVEMPYPRAKAWRQIPKAIKHQLEARTAEQYGALPAVA
jgi:ELWxxDGT repeat protein